jgi:quercetin dioxygenase-like cupin family protein
VAEPTVVGPGAGEVIADTPERRIEVLCEEDALHATRVRIGAGREGADLHVHRRHHDVFYVLSGELTVRLGPAGEAVALPAGTLARVPPLVVHGYRNASGAEATFLNVHAPGEGFAAYLRALRDGRPHTFDQEPPPADGGRSPADVSVGRGGGAGGRTTLLTDAEEIAVGEVAAEPGAAPPPGAAEGRAEWLYVLDGEAEVAAPGCRLEATAGSWVTIPPGLEHGWSVAGDRPARLLCISAGV